MKSSQNIKKILVKAPSSQEDVVLSFPLLKDLRREFPSAQLNIILERSGRDVINFFDQELILYEIPEDVKGLFDVHKFVYNQKDIFNIDLFIDLENSLRSAFLGYNFRSKYRVGVANGLNKWLLTHRMEHSNTFFDSTGLSLLGKFLAKGQSMELFSGNAEALAPLQDTLNGEAAKPYLAIVLDRPEMIFEQASLLNNLIKSFDDYEFHILTMFSHSENSKELNLWYQRLPKQNNYFFGEIKDRAQFLAQVIHSKGLITDQTWVGLLSTYYGVDAFVLDAKPMFPGNFRLFPHFITKNDGETLQLTSRDGNSPFSDITAFSDYLHTKLNI